MPESKKEIKNQKVNLFYTFTQYKLERKLKNHTKKPQNNYQNLT